MKNSRMDARLPTYLACPERGLKLAVGWPIYGSNNRAAGFSIPTERPGHQPTRRVLLQALSKLVADSPAREMSFHEGGSMELRNLCEIGGETGTDTISLADYLADQPVEWVTYYAMMMLDSTRANPSGVVRRREIAESDWSEDEAFMRSLRWERTYYLLRYWMGHDDIPHVEISEGEALRFVLRLLLRELPFVSGPTEGA